MATFGSIAGAEPSTVTFTVATVTQTRNSSLTHQEIVSIGDPESSLGLAAVLGAAPASTTFGMVVRRVGDSTSIIHGDSTVFQGSSAWQVQVSNGNSSVTISAIAAGAGRINIGSTAADNLVLISGNSTAFQGGAPWSVSQVAGSTWNVRAQNSSAADLLTQISGNSTVVQGTNPWTIAGNSTVFQGSSLWQVQVSNGNSSVTITAIAAGAGRLNIGSTAADNAVLVSGNSTVFQGGAPWTVAEVMQSTVAPSSNSSGIIVRQIVDNILTTASTNAFTSTSLTIQSSAASIRSYVTAYSILSTNAGPSKVRFYSGSTLLWPLLFAAVSSAVSGANLAVSAPAYLFRTKVAGPLSLNLGGGNSTVAGFQVAVSYFRAP